MDNSALPASLPIATRAAASASHRSNTSTNTSTSSAPTSPVRSSPVRVASSERLTIAQRRAETMKAIKLKAEQDTEKRKALELSILSTPPRPATRTSSTATRSVATASPPRRASLARRAPTSSSAVTESDPVPTPVPAPVPVQVPVQAQVPEETPAPAPVVSNAEETKRLEAVIIALQQQMHEFVAAQESKIAQLTKDHDAAKVALLEHRRLADMADSFAKTVSGLQAEAHDLEQDVADKDCKLSDLQAQVDTLEGKLLAVKMIKTTSRSSLLPSVQQRMIDMDLKADRFRTMMQTALAKAKDAQIRPVDISESHESMTASEASSVFQHSFASTTDSERFSDAAAIAPMAIPVLSTMVASQATVTEMDASSTAANNLMDRVEAMLHRH